MMKCIQQHRELLIGIGVAFFIAILINLPLWHSLLTTDEWSLSTVTTESADELFYLTRIREVVDGYPAIGNPVIYERRTQKYLLGQLWENIVHYPVSYFGWRIKTLSIVLDALFPFLLALTAWYAFAPLLQRKQWRFLALSMLFLGTEILLWKRPISPQQTFILPLLYMWAFLGTNRLYVRPTLLRSSLIGLMLYSYPFHWTYCLAVEVTLWGSVILRERTLSTARVQQIASAMIPLTLIAIPWIIATHTLSLDSAYTETMSRLGLIDRHLPVAPILQAKILFGLLCLWMIARWKKIHDRTFPLIILSVAGLLVLNQTLLTGKEAEFSSHYINILMIPFVLTVTVVADALTAHTTVWRRIVLLFIASIVAITTIRSTAEGYKTMTEQRSATVERTDTEGMIAILQSLPKEQVILTENSFAPSITTYTSHYPYTAYEAYMYLAKDEELIERARVYNLLFPEVPLRARAVFGTRYENQRLHARSLCQFRHLLGITREDCFSISISCEECSRFENPDPLTDHEIIQSLKDAQVSYAVLRTIPTQLLNTLDRIDGSGEWSVYRLRSQR